MKKPMRQRSAEWIERPGYDALWQAFGLSRASWLTLPRALMHEMPDDWQARCAELLQEWDDTWDAMPAVETAVQMKRDGRYIAIPDVIGNYRHPDRQALAAFRRGALPRPAPDEELPA